MDSHSQRTSGPGVAPTSATPSPGSAEPGRLLDVAEMAEQLARVGLFVDVDVESLASLAGQARHLVLGPGELLVAEGDAADEMYVVVEGELTALAAEAKDHAVSFGEFGPGSVLGEIAVLTGGRRSASVRAVGPVRVLGLPTAAVARLIDEVPSVGRRLAAEARRRLDAAHLLVHLHRLFPGMRGDCLTTLVADVTWTTLTPGEILFHEGDEADVAFVVVSGRLRVIVEGDDGPEVVGEIGRGELAGEMALLLDDPRSATLVAARDTVLAGVPRDVFERVVLTEPSAMLEVSRTIVRRSRDAMDPYRRAGADRVSIGILPLRAEVDIRELVAGLAERLARYGSANHMTADHVERVLGIEGIADAREGTADELRLDRWMHEQEDRSNFTLLEAAPVVSPWTRRCVRSVDHLVLVADAAGHPDPTELERLFVSARDLPHQRVSLVLLHSPDEDRPTGTSAWLESRDVDDHYHVRRGVDGDLDRLTRHLAGRAVGLVLSGGGAKGFAHLGVMQILEERGIPVDAVAGVSMGAPLAAVFAMMPPSEERVDRVADYYAKVLDYTFPAVSMVAGKRIAKRIVAGADGRSIEDLWIPFFTLSTNLTRSRLVVHRRGDLATAVRASLSIPGILPPVPYGEDLLVDAGALNNLPVDLIRRMYPTGTIIASDVAPALGPRARSDYGMHVSGTKLMLQRMIPGVKPPKAPPLMATLMRSLMVAAAQQRDQGVARGLADLHLEFDLRGVGLLDFDETRSVAELGYEEARPQVDAWLDEAAPSF